jgi:Mg-chelatase subunit ChlD
MEKIQSAESRDVQFALICYRDHADDYTTKVFPFTNSVRKAKEYVDTMSAAGGGDTPEAVRN